ncbi:prenyltransferase/squalene oxidase repeat-containing protein [Halobacillus yeomjeoni]|uniref:Squalene--hopene cyclase n=1 Tax=Halobacillus yeomjeoni TaxID=311194 RepID=A0A931HU86_9BACI|nr:prenyltransferase/squalene oxidase repeat-containing protein [Halobacillus yeomjeoni]MBH0229777.1 squalene--hopene cyclase [Halobacillus yeomjeoni]
MIEQVQMEMDRLVRQLQADQREDGSWDYAFDTGIMTDAYMIILLRILEIDDEELVYKLTQRIESKQEDNGSWKLYHNEKAGNLSRTIEAYIALLVSGVYSKEYPALQKSKQFIVAQGGIGKAGAFTKILLTLLGQRSWPKHFPVPIGALLLPSYFPVNIYRVSVFGRANIIPILLFAHQKYQVDLSIDLSDLQVRNHESDRAEFFQMEEWRGYFNIAIDQFKSYLHTFFHFNQAAVDFAKEYMLKRIEPDGTFLSYFSSTFYMVIALLSIGYEKTHPVILNAVEGLKAMETTIDGWPHIQYTTADVWNTSLISSALQEAGVEAENPMIVKANHFLLTRQHTLFGDWILHNTRALPGGWGFSNINTINPDVDDTTASLRAVIGHSIIRPEWMQAWYRGLQWTLSMQNDDGGWPAFERGVGDELLKWVPVKGAAFVLSDASSADLTGRTLEFLGNTSKLNKDHPQMIAGKKWLKENQRADGSWYGRWGICYIYGNWAALTGLMAAGEKQTTPAVQRGVDWLERIQNKDGGWGESCESDLKKQYVPLEKSTLTHTAWALEALIAASDFPTDQINRGIQYLVKEGQGTGWEYDYPKGQGMGGEFYIHYHSYRYIWPLQTLSRYIKKYSFL